MSYNKYKLCYKYVKLTRNLCLKYFDNLFLVLFLKFVYYFVYNVKLFAYKFVYF